MNKLLVVFAMTVLSISARADVTDRYFEAANHKIAVCFESGEQTGAIKRILMTEAAQVTPKQIGDMIDSVEAYVRVCNPSRVGKRYVGPTDALEKSFDEKTEYCFSAGKELDGLKVEYARLARKKRSTTEVEARIAKLRSYCEEK